MQGILRDPRDKAIVQSLVEIAAALGLNVVGIGIETSEQALKLVELGCPRGQGYVFAPVLPAEEFERYLAGQREKCSLS